MLLAKRAAYETRRRVKTQAAVPEPEGSPERHGPGQRSSSTVTLTIEQSCRGAPAAVHPREVEMPSEVRWQTQYGRVQ
jgi:hypothetical protein